MDKDIECPKCGECFSISLENFGGPGIERDYECGECGQRLYVKAEESLEFSAHEDVSLKGFVIDYGNYHDWAYPLVKKSGSSIVSIRKRFSEERIRENGSRFEWVIFSGESEIESFQFQYTDEDNDGSVRQEIIDKASEIFESLESKVEDSNE
jgi:DNA-directed RNA polymerase subunit RPC12/RpoP